MNCKINNRPTFRPACESLEERALLSAGNLDPSFGTGGLVVSSFSNWADGVLDVNIQSDGKILGVGYSPGSFGQDFGIFRYTSAGELDSTFGTGGKVITDFKRGTDIAQAAAIQSDGKIVAVGKAGYQKKGTWTEQSDSALSRYLPTGKLDTTFGSKGKLTLDIGGYDYGMDVVLWQDKIVVAGVTSALGYQSIYIARFNSNGSLDTSFGTAGKTILSQRTPQADIGMAIQNDGKLLITAMEPNTNTGSDFMVARVTTSGTLDSTFGNNGIVRIDFGNTPDYSKAIAVQSDNKILVAGSANGVFAVSRLNSDGTLDSAFDGDGKALTQVGYSGSAYDLAIQSDGKIIVTGHTDQDVSENYSAEDFVVVRYTSSGGLDSTFGSGGIVTTDFGARDLGYASALQRDGKIVVAGKTSNSSMTNDKIALARYLGDSALLASAVAPYEAANVIFDSDVHSLLPSVLARWQGAGFEVSVLGNIDIHITSLPGATLGLVSGNTIWLDDDAAGWGWFVDPTPWDYSEFLLPGDQGEQDRMDLLTVIMHEMGHVLGYEHEDHGVMQPILSASTRWGIDPHDLDGLFAILATEGDKVVN